MLEGVRGIGNLATPLFRLVAQPGRLEPRRSPPRLSCSPSVSQDRLRSCQDSPAAVLDFEPQRHSDRTARFFDQVGDEPGGAGDQHDTAHRFGWDADVDEGCSPGAGTVDRQVPAGDLRVHRGDMAQQPQVGSEQGPSVAASS